MLASTGQKGAFSTVLHCAICCCCWWSVAAGVSWGRRRETQGPLQTWSTPDAAPGAGGGPGKAAAPLC